MSICRVIDWVVSSDLAKGFQEEPLSLVRCATHEQELPSKWEDWSENTVKSNENTKCAYKPFSNRENAGEYNVSEEAVHMLGTGAKEECESLIRGKEKFECTSKKNLGLLISEETMEVENDLLNFRRREQKNKVFLNGPHSLQNKLICIFCRKNFARKDALKKHIRNFHEKPKKPATCPYCLEQFSLLSFPNHHKKCTRLCFKPKFDYELQCSTCEICEKTFLNKRKLKAHIKNNHEGRPKKKPERVSCKVCYRSFNDKYYLEKHMVFEHKNTVPMFVLCSLCEKEFTIISIASHKRKCKMSDKEKEECKEKNKAVCQDCGQTLSCKQKLKRHNAKVHSKAIND